MVTRSSKLATTRGSAAQTCSDTPQSSPPTSLEKLRGVWEWCAAKKELGEPGAVALGGYGRMWPVGQAALVWRGAKTLRANAHVCNLEKEQAQESRLNPIKRFM